MSEEIPQWAFDRAVQEVAADERYPGIYLKPFARYIAQHEQPPVDPDVIAVREILAAYERTAGGTPRIAGELETGARDENEEFTASLTAYRKHKEAGT